MNIQGTLEAIHCSVQEPAFGDDTVIDEPQWISASLRMAPAPDVLHRNGRWVQTRSQHLGDDRTLYAAELSRISDEIAGRPRGARIWRMNAVDLLHRTVVDEHGVGFHVVALAFDGYSAQGRCGSGCSTWTRTGSPSPTPSEIGMSGSRSAAAIAGAGNT